MHKLIPTLLAALILPLSSMNAQAAGCNRGDTRCTADGYVQSCEHNQTFNSSYWSTNPSKRCATNATCTEGDQKCGSDGYVLKCSRDNKWESWPTACK